MSVFRKPKRRTVIFAAVVVAVGLIFPAAIEFLIHGVDTGHYALVPSDLVAFYVMEVILFGGFGLLVTWQSRSGETTQTRFDAVVAMLTNPASPTQVNDVSTEDGYRVFVLRSDPTQSITVKRSNGGVHVHSLGHDARARMNQVWAATDPKATQTTHQSATA